MKLAITAQFLGYRVDKREFKDANGNPVQKETYYGSFFQDSEGAFNLKMDGKIASLCERGKVHTFGVAISEFEGKTYFRITDFIK